MDFLKQIGDPGTIALIVICGGIVAGVFLWVIWGRVSSIDSRLEEIGEHVGASLDQRLSRGSVEMAASLRREVGSIRGEIQGITDTVRSDLVSTVNDISQQIGEFRQQQNSTSDTNQKKIMSELSEQSVRMHERLLQLSTDSAQRILSAREEMLAQAAEISEDGRRNVTEVMGVAIKEMDGRFGELRELLGNQLGKISDDMGNQLEGNFKNASEAIRGVLGRLTAIDEAQKRIESLSGDVVNLSRVLNDKRATGAFGEIQLSHLVRDMLSPEHYTLNADLGNGESVQCLLMLPEPTGNIAIDASLPLENYYRMQDDNLSRKEIENAKTKFGNDVMATIQRISKNCIAPPKTTNGAALFVPTEAAFAEIHANHRKAVEEGFARHVWIVSPTTTMALLNMARAVIKDTETRRENDHIKRELKAISHEIVKFDQQLQGIEKSLDAAHQDVQKARLTSRKISTSFGKLGSSSEVQRINESSKE